MKLIGMTFAATLALALGGAGYAQDTTKTKTEVRVKDGKDVHVVGCVEASGSGKFALTHAADDKGALPDYMLVTDDNLSKHVGHRVEIAGVATDRGDGKLEVKRESTTKVEGGDNQKSKSTSEIKGDLGDIHYLKVKSVKMIAAACQ